MRLRPKAVLLAALLAGCAHSPPAARAPAPAEAVLLEGMGPYSRPLAGVSPEVQRWFDQGLNLTYAFRHDEGALAFRHAAELDPSCALCLWGIAWANGPDINSHDVSPEQSKAALEALARAQPFLPRAAPVERALIGAIRARFADPAPKERATLDRAFADAMQAVAGQFPQDADVAAVQAAALMQLRPWKLWRKDGQPEPEVAPTLAALDRTLQLAPRHPLANHLRVHALEASPHPEQADAAADMLRSLAPGLGHLLHMPSHIDVRTGRWARAVEANQRAIEADQRLCAALPAGRGFSPYMAHDHHMLAFAAMMSGRRALAEQAVRTAWEGAQPGWNARPARAGRDAYEAMVYEVWLRFGRWGEILAAPEPREDLLYTGAIHRMARAVALAAQGEVGGARDEQALFAAARDKVPAGWSFKKIAGSALLDVAGKLLEGEILFRAGREEEGLASLRAAVAAEDALDYSEPPAWIQPCRHALGAALLQAGRNAEAEAVFHEDLRRLPENGWALFGLGRALRLQGKAGEAQEVEARFDRAWAGADVQIKSSCFCQSGL
jgi:tetratricopeptide (TPR) repeat protein